MCPKVAALRLRSVVCFLFLLQGTLNAVLFEPPQNYVFFSSGGEPTSVAIADLNGDGHPDLAVTLAVGGSNGQGVISILLGAGDGTFVQSNKLSSGAGFPTRVAAADMNRDGRPDLVVANCASTVKQGSCPDGESDGVVAVFLGNGDGTFQTPITYDGGGGGSISLVISDLNKDGLLDVVVGNECADQACTTIGGAAVLLGNGDGTLKTAVPYNGYGQGSVALGDVNRDGNIDLILGAENIGVLLGNGDGTFTFFGSYATASHSGTTVGLADLNQDGILDAVAVGACAGTCQFGLVSVLFGNGDGSFQTAAFYWAGGAVPSSVAVASLFPDGHPDVIVSDCSTTVCGPSSFGEVSIFRVRADGTLRRPVRFPSGGFDAYFAAVGDLNSDGRPDLVVTDYFSDDIGVLLNTSGEAP